MPPNQGPAKIGWAAYAKLRRKKAVAAGMCMQCCSRRAARGKSACKVCRERQSRIEKGKRAAAKEERP